ncbi:FUSC family protein [Streptomyces sp. AM 4-1-1]|uniref:FUSC family protein n=1 Tax=Streptomyces sp. AM 4-1-1 TaxID=3028710 RepID=UPI0023B8C633|nr:FUSC family protein [Streptomyces sp. AM 4-1-1]WEH37542.1 FUSC family protein [Streptomyces sp. AM 4-1-1]
MKRATPPPWLLSGLRPKNAPIPWAAVARAAVALSAPLAVGFATDRPAYGALVSMGALSGVIGDTADAYRMRVLNIAVPQLFGALGIMLGTLVYGAGWTAVVALTVIGLISGMMSTIGAVASVSGLLLLLNSVVGAGLPMPDPWWKAPLLLTAGGLVVLALTLLAWPLRGKLPERVAVANTYRAVADMLATAGTDAYEARRQDVTQSLNTSYDLILARRARYHGRSAPMVRLLSQLNVVIPLVEAAPAVHLRRRPLPPGVPDAVRALADAVEENRTGHTESGLPAPDSAATRAVDSALRHATAVVHGAEPDPHNVDDRLGRPAALGVRVRRITRDVLLSRPSWRYGLRLAVCIGLAQALVSLVDVPRSYWVALTVTFVLKPDFGSVFSRAVLRAVGTAAGLVIAAPVLAEVPIGWWDVPVMVVLAALIPAFTAKGYAFQTAAITPVILLLSDLLNRQGVGLVQPRFLDSLIGCGIVLVAGYLLWPESWHSRVGHRLADAVTDIADYVGYAFDPSGERVGRIDQGERVRARRRIYRDLSVVRSEFQRALTEPPPVGTRAAAWWPLVVAVERIVDATTAARVRVNHGAPEPPPSEVAAIQRELRGLAAGIRASEVLVEVRTPSRGAGKGGGDGGTGGSGDEGADGVLEPLHQEVAAARAIASPRP